MLERCVLVTALAFALAAPGCAVVAGDDAASGTDGLTSLPNETAWAQGTNWSYETEFMGLPRAWVYRPVSFSKKSPGQRGAIFHLLGCGELPYQLAQGSGWPEAAEAAGMVIVIPDIISPAHPNTPAPNVACYNFGAGLASEPTRTSPDHKAIIAAGQKIVTDTTLKVDARQVYLTGFSAGATVAMQVACMAPDVFAGVGSVAGPSMGTDQSKAVMPPTNTSDQIRSKCTSYAQGASDKLATQIYAIVSDNNGLPAGNPVQDSAGHWTADKFQKQTIWDGDKYVPHAHHDLITGAMATLFNARKTGSNVALPFNGTGSGCPNGENSHDDTGDTECTFAQAVQRNWQAKADVWTDSQGRTRIIHIQQDTLRHRWPSGPAAASDVTITPDRQALVDGGFILSNGQFDIDKVNGAPNGELGAVFFARDSFDFPMFFVDYLSKNNPRLPASPPTDLSIVAQATISAGGATTAISGTVTAPGKAHVVSVDVTFQGTAQAATIDSGSSQVSFAVNLDTHSLSAGDYSADVRAKDDAGHTATSPVSFHVGSAAQCFTAKNSQHVSANRAHYGSGLLKALANGSNDDLGYAYLANDQTSSVQEQAAGTWVKVASCP